MKINGTNVKGIKKAVGDWNKFEKMNTNRNCNIIVFDRNTNTVEWVPWAWYMDNKDERLNDGYLRYDNIIDLITDIYPDNYRVTMVTVQEVLREYVI